MIFFFTSPNFCAVVCARLLIYSTNHRSQISKKKQKQKQPHNSINYNPNTGFAYVGGACVVNKRLEKVNSVAIIEDTGGFSGIIVAAHEVGHL